MRRLVPLVLIAALTGCTSLAPRTMATPRIYLRRPALADQREFIARAKASTALHHPWVTVPATPMQFRNYVLRAHESVNHGWLVCRAGSDEIVGVITISNIVMGIFRSGYLGYYAFAGFERQGLMREGLRAVVRHAFKSLKLHRLEANIQPTNAPSIALVKALGFRREGYSPRYLKINGRWRDHERWAILAD